MQKEEAILDQQTERKPYRDTPKGTRPPTYIKIAGSSHPSRATMVCEAIDPEPGIRLAEKFARRQG